MSNKSRLLGTVPVHGLLDQAGNAIPVHRVEIGHLPLIDPRALPPLPKGVEARLLNVAGEDPKIVLFHPEGELHIEVSLLAQDTIPTAALKLAEAAAAQAMGEPFVEQPEPSNPVVKVLPEDLEWLWEGSTSGTGALRFNLRHKPLNIRLQSSWVMPEQIEAEKIRVLTLMAEKLGEHWA